MIFVINFGLIYGQVETLINDERIILAYDTINLYLESIGKRLSTIKKEGPENGFPKDMTTMIRSVIYSEQKLKVEELTKIIEKLTKFYGKKLINEALNEKELLNKIVRRWISNFLGKREPRHYKARAWRDGI